ncbi:LuxR C-terminal-related transcriptional regulator [Pseudomonas sp. 1912-s]|uniref:helix-turn-helix transcriptional regulator n=1 Tax=Pseudomonas sp. 1912-s TaxID=3033802 RepID=UPI0023DF81F5|nr:LuxR C-terminal-related transcriptional regulator [Pseudomonas sp. 1912-s]MDF3198363.1 LuxR C-terminal-related transcriptional regulator [Pseudomonas sp. 1912-s]
MLKLLIQFCWGGNGIMALNQILALKEVAGWHRDLAGLFDRQLDSELPTLLCGAMRQFIDHDNFILKVYDAGSDRPTIIAHDIPAHRHPQYFGAYFSSAYKQDPLLQRMAHGTGAQIVQINSATCALESSAYYQTYYHELQLNDEVDILLPMESGQSLVLSMGRRDGVTQRDELATLNSVYPLVECLLRKFWKQHASPLAGAHEQPVLTNREREVIQWMLNGKGTKEIARLLDISVQTVKVHRRNVYAKLGVSTELQLCSLLAAKPLP